MAYVFIVLSVLLGLVVGWHIKAWQDYSKTPQENLAMGYELKWYKYGPQTLLGLAVCIGSLALGLALLP